MQSLISSVQDYVSDSDHFDSEAAAFCHSGRCRSIDCSYMICQFYSNMTSHILISDESGRMWVLLNIVLHSMLDYHNIMCCAVPT